MVSLAPPEPEAWLRHKVWTDWSLPPEKRLFLAFSGGGDSTALLAAGQAIGLQLHLLHVNHHWHPDSDRWAAHAEQQAARYGYPCTVLDLPADLEGEGPEDRARQGRYALLAAQLRVGDWLLSAQHRDDQAETLLLQLLRGAGIDGLAAMPERRALGHGTLARPFLTLSRAQLQHYLRQRGLAWIEDPANADLRYARARVRQHIFPLLADLGWPKASDCLARSATNLADQRAVEDAWYLAQKQEIWATSKSPPQWLPVRAVQALSPPLQRVLLRRWLRDLAVPIPDQHTLQRLLRLCGPQQGGKRLQWQDVFFWRQGERLWFWRELPDFCLDERPWLPELPSGERCGFRWAWGKERPVELAETAVAVGTKTQLAASRLYWRRREEGSLYCNRSGQKRPVKKLWLELAVPPFLRDRIPILWTEAGEILCIPGFYPPALTAASAEEWLWVDWTAAPR